VWQSELGAPCGGISVLLTDLFYFILHVRTRCNKNAAIKYKYQLSLTNPIRATRGRTASRQT